MSAAMGSHRFADPFLVLRHDVPQCLKHPLIDPQGSGASEMFLQCIYSKTNSDAPDPCA